MNSANKQLASDRHDKQLIHVLLVERYRIILNALKQLIESDPRFHVCGVAANAETALQLTEQHRPNVIVLDLDLGEDSGLALIPKLIARSPAKIAVLTGSRETASLDQAILAGAKGIVRRDESPEVLFDAIEKIHQGELWLNRDATARLIEQIARAQAPAQITKTQQRLAGLTLREAKVVQSVLLAGGKPLKEISTELFISEHTLHNHLGSIYDKLAVANRLELYTTYRHELAHGALAAGSRQAA